MSGTFVREAGQGPGVVCLHANAASSSQWRSLMELLAPKFRVFAPDLHDAGRGPTWPAEREMALRDEAALVAPVLERAGTPLALVGHSYGAAVALIAALANPRRVHAMALYEPTLFALIDGAKPRPNDADGIRCVLRDCAALVERGRLDAAAERFVDYWMWPGAWRETPEARRPAISASLRFVRRAGHAVFTEATPLEAFRALRMPILYMTGRHTTPSALGVARCLVPVLPNVEYVELDAGHMGPVTHAELVNETIRRFLERV